MAKPPEPLEEMLPHATLVVIAKVARVVSTGAPLPPLPPTEEPKSDRGARSPEQKLELDVIKVLKGTGTALESIEVTKPVAPYAVKEGTQGAWLIDKDNVVLGRYGPDSWRASHVEAALK
jgi:hypothetical protein